ncbi:DUF503 domain-containing protein [Cellulosilyticum sp. I15G10I2]|uniref:DUF503 domain-containing protein n=1 Tax=Cellulosilyticum sp. I15G10I2 TaxID=1892843 RepID=UPI00085BCD39|nr:DUF503 domain-containing protein [Cellulosilyticum sp. I15G10I2]
MFVGVIKIKLYADWVHSLKEKRMIVQSIIGKTRHQFNVSINEIDLLDVHQTIMLGISMVSNSEAQLSRSLDKVISFIESHTEAVVMDIEIEMM